MAGWNFGPAGQNFQSFWGGHGGGTPPPTSIGQPGHVNTPGVPPIGGALAGGGVHPNGIPGNTGAPVPPIPAGGGGVDLGGGGPAYPNPLATGAPPATTGAPPPVTPPPAGGGSPFNGVPPAVPATGAPPATAVPPPTPTTSVPPPYIADSNMGGADLPNAGGPAPTGPTYPSPLGADAIRAGYTSIPGPHGYRAEAPGGIGAGSAGAARALARQTASGRPDGNRYDAAGNEQAFQASLANMNPQQKADAMYGHLSGDTNGLLRLQDAEFPSLIQTGESRIAQLQQWLNNPANAGNQQEMEIYKGYIAQEQGRLDTIKKVQQLRTQIGPYLQYLPKGPNGTDINWQYMAQNPDWANTLPPEVKNALFGMHIGEFANQIVSGH